jgi:hypothetical protein
MVSALLRYIQENVSVEIHDSVMEDTEPEDPQSQSEHVRPPSPMHFSGAAPKRFRVEHSTLESSLTDFVSTATEETDEAYLAVAKHILEEGILPLSQAAEIIGVKHSNRALEKLKRVLPIEAFSSSRKEGWFVVAKSVEHYETIATLAQRNRELEMALSRFSDFSRDDFEQLHSLLDPSEKVFMRYLLARLFGTSAAASRFGIDARTLNATVERVTSALAAADVSDGSNYSCANDFHELVAPAQRGARHAWEEDETTKSFVMGLIHKAV